MIVSYIPQLMKDRKITLAELSRRCGLSRKTVVKLYYADFTQIHIDVLDRLCEALDATPGDIFKYVKGARKPKPVLQDLPENTHPLNKRIKQVEVADLKEV